MDRITKSLIESFRTEQSLRASTPEHEAFEHFANYCVVCDAHDEEFDIHDVHTGGGQDLGLDGIATVVNGVLVNSADEVTDLLEVNGYLDVSFLFIQGKSGGNFSGEQIAIFFDGVDEFFNVAPTLKMNEKVANARTIMSAIYDNSVKFQRGKPSCRLSLVTNGEWTNDDHLVAKIEKRKSQLKETRLFSDVIFSPIDADSLHASYQRSKNNVTTEIVFAHKVPLPEIAGVTESYLGVIPAAEFLKLITDHSGNIRKSLFNENVRDFQDYNAVNEDIRSTLTDEAAKGRFVVLNNGVTIVTRDLKPTGSKITMTDYQIVNGCQTSHVLFDTQGHLTDSVQVPLKIIATDDEDVITSIITATNRQTQVSAEDLYALGGFQKKLEAFLAAYGGRKKLYYERRSKQYSASAGIEKVRIISKAQQIKSFAAMFLDDPHRAGRYYKDLQAQVGEKIFNSNHKLDPYYTAAYAYYKLEFFFRNSGLPVHYKPGRFHLLMALRYIVGGKEMPALIANKIQGYCNRICDVLWDDNKALEAFAKAIEAVESALDGVRLDRDVVRTQGFTDAVRRELGVDPKTSGANRNLNRLLHSVTGRESETRTESERL